MNYIEKNFGLILKKKRVYKHNASCRRMFKRKWDKGWLTVMNAMHITASVFINDDERGLIARF